MPGGGNLRHFFKGFPKFGQIMGQVGSWQEKSLQAINWNSSPSGTFDINESLECYIMVSSLFGLIH